MQLAWTNGDTANTNKSGNIIYTGSLRNKYRLEVENPGGELKVDVYDVKGNGKNFYVATYTVPAKATKTIGGTNEDFQCHAIDLGSVFVNTTTIRIIAYPTANVTADTTVDFAIQGVVS
jgi:hypothetical protein